MLERFDLLSDFLLLLIKVLGDHAFFGVILNQGQHLLWDNAYAQIIRNARGEILALYPLVPNKMTVDRDANGRLFYLYQKRPDDAPTLGKDSQVYLDPPDVLHMRTSWRRFTACARINRSFSWKVPVGMN